MLDRHKQLPRLTGKWSQIAERLIETVDSEIDALVYKLFGLSEDEVAVVEGVRLSLLRDSYGPRANALIRIRSSRGILNNKWIQKCEERRP